MKYFASTLFAAAILASTTLAAASESAGAHNHAPALRRSMHHQKRKQCSSHKKHKNSHKASSNGNSHAQTSGSNKSSSNNDSDDQSSSKSASSSSSTGGSSGSGRKLKLKGKQGLAWPNAGGLKIEPFLIGGVSWMYSWGATPKQEIPDDVVFCPMLWGTHGAGANVNDFKKNVLDNPNGPNNRDKCVMGPNEVNQKGQADMSVSETCAAMRQYIMPLADQGWYVLGPVTTSAPNGLDQWYKDFKEQCSDVYNRLDAIPLHYYDVTPSGFKKYVQNWHETLGKDIWITEFACQNFNGGAQCSKDDATTMMKEMTDWFLQQDYVIGFAPFGTMQNLQGVSEVNRLSQGSNPTSLFKMFADA